MNKKIVFNDEQTTWVFHNGCVEIGDEEYPFTLTQMGDNEFELTWIDVEPENSKELESEIINSL